MPQVSSNKDLTPPDEEPLLYPTNSFCHPRREAFRLSKCEHSVVSTKTLSFNSYEHESRKICPFLLKCGFSFFPVASVYFFASSRLLKASPSPMPVTSTCVPSCAAPG